MVDNGRGCIGDPTEHAEVGGWEALEILQQDH